MARLPKKQDIERVLPAGPTGVQGAGVSAPNVNTSASRIGTTNFDIMDQAIIPRMEAGNFSSERTQIASNFGAAARSQGQGFIDLARETLKFKADIDDERNKQEELAYLTAAAQYSRGMAELTNNLRSENASSEQWGPAIAAGSKSLKEQILLANKIPDHLREKFDLEIYKRETVFMDSANTEAHARGKEEEKARVLGNVERYESMLMHDPDPKVKLEAKLGIKANLQSAVDHGVMSKAEAMRWWDKKGLGTIDNLMAIQAQEDPAKYNRMVDGEQGARDAIYGVGGNESKGPEDWSAQNPVTLYLGRSQFGADRLSDLGFYKHGPGEKAGSWWKLPNDKKWTGTWTFPGAGEDGGDLVLKGMQGKAYFLGNPKMQEAAEVAHFALMRKEIKKHGLDKYIGQTIGGVRVTRSGLYMALHLGGVGRKNKDGTFTGVKGWLRQETNSADVHGTSVGKYMAEGRKYDLTADADPKELLRLTGIVQTKIKEDIDSFGNGIAGGEPIPPSEIEKVQALAASTYDSTTIAKADQLEELNTLVIGLRQSLPHEIRMSLSNLRGQMKDGGTDWQRKLEAHHTAALNKLNKDLDTNVLDTAESTGAIPAIPPLNLSDPDSMKDQIALAQMAANHYKRPLKDVLREQDKEGILRSLQDAPTSQRALIVESIVRAWGPQAGLVANQITDDHPVVANLIQLRINNQIAPKDMKAILAHLPDEVTGAEGEDQKQKFSITENYDFRNASLGLMGNALAFTDEDVIETRVMETAKILYAIEARKQSIVEGPIDTTLWEKSIQKAAGQMNGKGGFGSYNGETVLLPAHMDTYDIDSAVDTITMDNVSKFSKEGATTPIGINRRTGEIMTLDDDDLQDAHLITVGPGQYALTLHDPEDPNREFFLRADDPSKAFILNLNDFDMEDAKRGAFIDRYKDSSFSGSNLVPDASVPGLVE